MENNIRDRVREAGAKGKKNLKKAIAVGLSLSVLTVGTIAALDARTVEKTEGPELLNPEPVVMEIDDADAVVEDSSGENDEEEAKKRGVFGYLKAALYAFFAGIAGFFATKIPWKKIFTKRNLIILLILILLFLFGKYILPMFADVPWGQNGK